MTTMTTSTEYVQTINHATGQVSFTLPKPVPPPPVTPPPAVSAQFGCYTGAGDASGSAAFEAQVGPLPWRLDFTDGTGLFQSPPSTYPVPQWKGCGKNLLLGVDMIPSCAPGQGGPGFAAVAAGTYDANFTAVAQALLAAGFTAKTCMIRLGWEFNGGWFPWAANGMAPQFIAAFQHIVVVMRRVIPGLPTMWNPTRGDLGVGDLATYFPGAGYVTCAALDCYETEWQSGAVTSPAEYQHQLTQSYGLEWLAAFCKSEGVQCGLGEWGLWPPGQIGTAEQQGGGDDPAFTTSMCAWIKANCGGPAICWDNGPTAFSVMPKSLAALKTALSVGV